MTLTQISIFVENRQGRLAHVSKVLADAGVNIYALSLADTSDFGILRLIVSDINKARCVLKEHGIVCSTAEVIGVVVQDIAGNLFNVLNTIEQQNLSIEYMYAMRVPTTQKSALIFRFDQPLEAVELLSKTDMVFVTHKDIEA